MLGGVLFILQASLRALFMRMDALFISTNPPTSPIAGVILHALRRVPVTYWVMDLNPDQYVALGHAREGALVVRAFDAMQRAILKVASNVIVLDRFMAERVNAKRDVREKMHIIPPWSRDEHLRPIAHADSGFRTQFGLEDKFVVMYSGNHGPSNPLKTLLDAAHRLKDDPRFAFAFVGGGVGKREVDEAAKLSPNILSLPYWPLEDLSNSLSAADVHAVTMGDEVVGIVHPSKIYGAFAVERPILLVGPPESHIGDILERHPVGWAAAHGDVDGVVRTLLSLVEERESVLTAGRRAKSVAEDEFSLARLNGRLGDLIEACAKATDA
jgi:glycosyltransferase involved in cell wall biosynthesis